MTLNACSVCPDMQNQRLRRASSWSAWLTTAKTLELQAKPMCGDGQQNRIKNKLPKIIHRIRLDMDALY